MKCPRLNRGKNICVFSVLTFLKILMVFMLMYNKNIFRVNICFNSAIENYFEWAQYKAGFESSTRPTLYPHLLIVLVFMLYSEKMKC